MCRYASTRTRTLRGLPIWLNAGKYLTGPYAAIPPGGSIGDGQTSITYDLLLDETNQQLETLEGALRRALPEITDPDRAWLELGRLEHESHVQCAVEQGTKSPRDWNPVDGQVEVEYGQLGIIPPR